MQVIGYARNYLFPKKLALEANNENTSKLKAKLDAMSFKRETDKDEAMKLAKKLEEITLNIYVKAGENGKIFGGVTSKEIENNLKEEYKIEIDKKKIIMPETIKVLGCFVVEIRLFEGVIAKLKVQVKAN